MNKLIEEKREEEHKMSHKHEVVIISFFFFLVHTHNTINKCLFSQFISTFPSQFATQSILPNALVIITTNILFPLLNPLPFYFNIDLTKSNHLINF